MVSSSVPCRYAGAGAFFGDLEKVQDLGITHDVWILSARRAMGQHRKIDFGPVPIGMVSQDDIRSRLLDDSAEALQRLDVGLNALLVWIEPHSAPQNRKVRRPI